MSLYGVGAALPPYSPATSNVYYPQFAAVGVAVGGRVQAGQAPGLYMTGGQAMMAVASSHRLQSMYVSIGHGMGCACQHCQFAGVAATGGVGATAGFGMSISAMLTLPAFMQGAQAQYGAAMAGVGGVAGAGSLSGGFAGSAALSARIQEDPHGKSQSGQGSSNLANSPEVMLALEAVLKGKGNKKFEDIKKTLEEDYGIRAEVGDITLPGKDGKEGKTVKGLKFPNGDYFVDGNGNGQLDAGDYKFGDAVKSLKERYNLTDDNLKSITDRMKATAEQRKQFGAAGAQPYGHPGALPGYGYPGGQPGYGGPAIGGYPMGPGLPYGAPAGGAVPVEVALANLFGGGTPSLMHQPQANYAWMAIFLRAYQLAAPMAS